MMNDNSLSQIFTIKTLRFAISGLFVTGVHVLIATILISFILITPSLANGVAFVVATLFSYLINTLWSFSNPLHRRNLYRFFLVSFIGLLLSISISGAAQYGGLHYWYGIAFVVCIVPAVTFLLHNFWTYQ